MILETLSLWFFYQGDIRISVAGKRKGFHNKALLNLEKHHYLPDY